MARTLLPFAKGLTTHAVPTRNRFIKLEFDLLDYNLMIRSSDGRRKAVGLYDGLAVAQFYSPMLGSLTKIGSQVELLANPFDPPRVGSDLPFAKNEIHARYDAVDVTHFWQVLARFYGVLLEFKGRFYGKSTPVHLFWPSLNLTYMRFLGHKAPM